MIISRFYRAHRMTFLAALLAAIAVAGCSDSTEPEDDTDPTVVLRDVTLAFTAGISCDVGGVSTSFTAAAGTTVTILAAGASNLTPLFVLYAPDFSTQIGSSEANGAGRARLIITLAASGEHHVTLCEANARGGSVKVTVTRPG